MHFFLYSFLYSRDNEAVQKLNGVVSAICAIRDRAITLSKKKWFVLFWMCDFIALTRCCKLISFLHLIIYKTAINHTYKIAEITFARIQQNTLVTSLLGPIVFPGKFFQILWASSRKSTSHCGKSVQIQQLATASIYDGKLRRAVQKLQLLKAGIVLSYVGNIKENYFSFQKCNETHDSWCESTEMSDWWLMYRVAQIEIPQQKKFHIFVMGKDFWIKFSALQME